MQAEPLRIHSGPPAEPSAAADAPAPKPKKKRRRRRLPLYVADAQRLSPIILMGVRTIRTMNSAGKMPRPIRLGTRVVWSLREIRAWLDAGAPDRATWEKLKKAAGR